MKRRDFIKTLALASVSVSIPATASMDLSEDKCNNDYIGVVMYAWNSSFKESPLDYLNKKGALVKNFNLDNASKEDFLEKKIINVDGLMLSKTEAAFLIMAKGLFS